MHGRVNVPDFIVFLTDGEANIGSVYSKTDPTFPQGGKDDIAALLGPPSLSPTGTRLRRVTIYSIGYALGNNNCTGGGFRKSNLATPASAGATMRWLPHQRRCHREPGRPGHNERDDHLV